MPACLRGARRGAQLEKKMEAMKDDAEAVKEFGIEFGADLCRALLKVRATCRRTVPCRGSQEDATGGREDVTGDETSDSRVLLHASLAMEGREELLEDQQPPTCRAVAPALLPSQYRATTVNRQLSPATDTSGQFTVQA